jgi:hypothetical protein
MATVSNVALSVVRDIANADISLEYDINWSSFDQLTNVEYDETWKLIGDGGGGESAAFTGPSPDRVQLSANSSWGPQV